MLLLNGAKKTMKICPKNRCTGCGVCGIVCPTNAIKMEYDDKGFITPQVDDEKCVECGKCISYCHVNRNGECTTSILEVYSVCAKDIDLRMGASSGGVVSIFAKNIFENGGVVVGAVFDENKVLHEDIAYSWDEYTKRGFARSKYVQSETRKCFSEIKLYLDNNKGYLLFVGTPCQNSALKKYLGDIKYENLIQIDFVCHGVPSPAVFSMYCKHLEEKYNSKIENIRFRVKKPSWSLSSTEYQFESGKIYRGNMMQDGYNVGFVTDIFLRESCYECKYASAARYSDITVCDYWGSREKTITDEDDKCGVSAMIIHTDKGKKLFDDTREKMLYKQVSYASVVAGNARLEYGRTENGIKELFWEDYQRGLNWHQLKKKYFGSLLKKYKLKSRIAMKYRYSVPFELLKILKKGWKN